MQSIKIQTLTPDTAICGLQYDELNNIKGGIVCGGACVVGLAAGAAFLTGVGIGVALY